MPAVSKRAMPPDHHISAPEAEGMLLFSGRRLQRARRGSYDWDEWCADLPLARKMRNDRRSAMSDEADDAAEPSPGAAPVKTTRWPFLGGRSNRSTILPAASALLLEHSSDGVLIADMRARGQPIVHVNPAFESITGYAAAEVLGKNCRYLQGSDRLQPEITEIRAALAQLRACSVTLRRAR